MPSESGCQGILCCRSKGRKEQGKKIDKEDKVMPRKDGDIRYDEYYKNQFNTQLSAENEARFNTWMQNRSNDMRRDLSKDLVDYDLRGYWLNGGYKNGSRKIMSEKYKKPNHRTFTKESIYHGMDSPYGVPFEGGSWDDDGNFIPSDMQRNVMGWKK
jgi:hypothetical protein